jgi:hypothetical protein
MGSTFTQPGRSLLCRKLCDAPENCAAISPIPLMNGTPIATGKTSLDNLFTPKPLNYLLIICIPTPRIL